MFFLYPFDLYTIYFGFLNADETSLFYKALPESTYQKKIQIV